MPASEEGIMGLGRVVAGLEACKPDTLHRLLKEACNAKGEVPVAVALAALSTIQPAEQAPPWLYEQSLEVLASSEHPLAGSALLKVATGAENATVRLEAIRRLGRKPSAEGRRLLRDVARTGYQCRATFPRGTVTDEQKRVAAVEALGGIGQPEDGDISTVLEVLRAESAAGNPSGLFGAGIKALSAICRVSDVPSIVDLAKSARNPLLKVHLVGVLSKFEAAVLMPCRTGIVQELVAGLHALQDNQREPSRELAHLASKVTCRELVDSLPMHGTMEQGKGAVAAAALEAYGKPDETLTKAYLRFAQAEANASSGGPCVSGLMKCAQNGYADFIVSALVRQSYPGYSRLLQTGVLSTILGGSELYVRHLCQGLDAAEQVHRTRALDECITGIVCASLKPDDRQIVIGSLDRLRGNGQAVLSVLGRLQPAEAALNCISLLAEECFAAGSTTGKTALAGSLLSPRDDLMAYFRQQLLNRGVSLRATRPEDFDAELAVRQLEPALFPSGDPWEPQHLADYALVAGKVNCYVLDLMRRRGHRLLPEAARKALGAAESLEEAGSVLACLAAAETPQACQVIAWATGYEGKDSNLILPIRQRALETLGGLGQALQGPGRKPILTEALEAIHARLQDQREVRRAAYQAAAAFADPTSICQLRERLTEEKDTDLLGLVKLALEAIARRLRAGKPNRNEAAKLRGWLEHVGQLREPSFLDDAMDLIGPVLHSDETVLTAALECAGMLGEERAIPAIKEFLKSTSCGGSVRQKAQHAIAVLRWPSAVGLLDVLSVIFPGGSEVLDLEIDFEALLGRERLSILTSQLREFVRQWEDHHWDDCACLMDNVCDTLQMVIFERYYQVLAWAEKVAQSRLKKDYGNRLHMPEFRRAFPDMQAFSLLVHNARDKSRTPHPVSKAGAERSGVEQAEIEVILDLFRQRFPALVRMLRSAGDRV